MNHACTRPARDHLRTFSVWRYLRVERVWTRYGAGTEVEPFVQGFATICRQRQRLKTEEAWHTGRGRDAAHARHPSTGGGTCLPGAH